MNVLEQRALTFRACRDCGAFIWLARSEHGKTMAMDWEPNARGNCVLFELDDRVYVRVLGMKAPRPEGTVVWMPHAATCTRRRARTGRAP